MNETPKPLQAGPPCGKCLRPMDHQHGFLKCWRCERRQCPSCGDWHGMMFFQYCHRCEAVIRRAEERHRCETTW